MAYVLEHDRHIWRGQTAHGEEGKAAGEER